MADEKDPKLAAKPAAPPAETVKAPDFSDMKKKPAKGKLSVPVLKPREKQILNIFLFCVVLLALDLVMIRPIVHYLQKLDESIKLKEEIIPKRLLILKHKDRILGQYRALKPFFVDGKVSQEEETAQFLREIERVSKETSFFVSTINPVKVNKVSDVIYELSLDVEGKGGLKEVRQFMRTLENANPPIRVSSFNLKPQNKEAEELKVLFSIVKLGVKKNHPAVQV